MCLFLKLYTVRYKVYNAEVCGRRIYNRMIILIFDLNRIVYEIDIRI